MAVIGDWVIAMALRRPRFLRDVTDLLRRTAPMIQMGNTVLVLGDEGVREVFDRPRDFLNGMVYAQKLKLGPLVLGMDDSCRYRAERELAERVLAGAEIVNGFTSSVGDQARRHLGSRLRVGQLDFVGDVVEPVFAAALCDLFGIQAGSAQSAVLHTEPGERTLIEWLRKLGGAISSNVPGAFGLEDVAEAVALEIKAYLSTELEVSTAPTVAVLRQTLGTQENVVRFVGGMLSAAAGAFKMATLAMNQLLEWNKVDELLAPHRRAAPVIAYVWEAARFDPPFPFLSRHCPRETTLGGRVVPAGSTVWVSLLSAMFDPNSVENPYEFCVPRPSNVYNVFGLGTHTCVAVGLASGGLGVLFETLFELLGARALRVRGPGKIRYDGAAVARYVIELTRSSVELEVITDAPRDVDRRRAVCPRNAA